MGNGWRDGKNLSESKTGLKYRGIPARQADDGSWILYDDQGMVLDENFKGSRTAALAHRQAILDYSEKLLADARKAGKKESPMSRSQHDRDAAVHELGILGIRSYGEEGKVTKADGGTASLADIEAGLKRAGFHLTGRTLDGATFENHDGSVRIQAGQGSAAWAKIQRS
jgi:hypothetical protein